LTSPSGKSYIGQSVEFQKRLYRHKIADTLIGRAIRKYGIERFRIEFLHETESHDTANDLEAKEIKNFNSLAPSGYNLTKGGERFPVSIEKNRWQRKRLQSYNFSKKNLYIIVYEWVLKHPDLTCSEALLLCEIMRWPNGCYKSSNQLGKLLRSDTRTIQRRIKSLIAKQWIAVLPDQKRNMRILYATPKEPPIGPLFEYKEKADQVIQKYMSKQAKELIDKAAENLATI